MGLWGRGVGGGFWRLMAATDLWGGGTNAGPLILIVNMELTVLHAEAISMNIDNQKVNFHLPANPVEVYSLLLN